MSTSVRCMLLPGKFEAFSIRPKFPEIQEAEPDGTEFFGEKFPRILVIL